MQEPEIDLGPGHLPVSVAGSSPGFACEFLTPKWYAVYTCARHEKRAAELLESKEVETFLPLYEALHRWKSGRAQVRLPLFPGYLFVRIALADRLKVLEIPSVVRLVGFSGQPAPLPEGDIEAVRSCLGRGPRFEPHPYLPAGRRVRVARGALEGLEGIVIRRKSRTRLVVSLDIILRSVAVEVEARDLEPVDLTS
ncbi:MAG TPA: UpxY family transcription antiterminator [Terriglobia bacterium]|nr:UpxY family transcription antiterminator [Terriglobia bacterium]